MLAHAKRTRCPYGGSGIRVTQRQRGRWGRWVGAHLAGSGRREGAGAQIARGETGFCFCVCECVVDRGDLGASYGEIGEVVTIIPYRRPGKAAGHDFPLGGDDLIFC